MVWCTRDQCKVLFFTGCGEEHGGIFHVGVSTCSSCYTTSKCTYCDQTIVIVGLSVLGYEAVIKETVLEVVFLLDMLKHTTLL